MSTFLSKDFLLTTEAAKKLYHKYAADMPIIDYHCHVSPKEIYEDRRFENITQVWLSGDHYKWRLMRANGVEEKYITGDAPDREKFQKFAELMPKAIGNPMYHWCHMELKNYFGCTDILNGETAQKIWEITEKKLHEPDMSVRGLIRQSNVKFIGTTDDPVDSLKYHELLAKDNTFDTVVAPSFRPDKALNIEKAGWQSYVNQLGKTAGVEITGIDTLELALKIRMEFFGAHGCRASDHGLDHMVYNKIDKSEVDKIIKRALIGEAVTQSEAEAVKTELLLFCAARYAEMGWAMQIHYNAMRNPNSLMFDKVGPDTGFDCIGPQNGGEALRSLLDALYRDFSLPKLIVYSLDGNDNAFLDSLIGSFQGGDDPLPGKLQHGAAWWFNDTRRGMEDQLKGFAEGGLLGNFIGMLTDSRSFLSYARHEYFRRILCELIGSWIENGELPEDIPTLGALVQDICYNNAEKFFK